MKYDYPSRQSGEYEAVKKQSEDRPCSDRKEKEKEKECCPGLRGIIFECGNRPEDAIFEIDDKEVEEHQHFILDSVLIDTSCLCKPQVKIEFSSLVYFKAETKEGGPNRQLEIGGGGGGRCESEVKVDLLFELVRVCNGVEEVVQNWRYLKDFEIEDEDELEIEISEPFTVTFCDRQCPGCCKYQMKVKGICFEGEFDALRVVKPDISAFAQGLCD